ncbi:MAG: cytochrome P450 [Pseudoruegeria sp.]
MPDNSPTPISVPLVSKPLGIWKSFQLSRQNLLEIIPELATRQPMVSGRTGKRWHMVMDPPSLKRILRDKLPDYPKSDVTKNILRPAIGESLFVAEGSHWHWQRRAAAPVFSHRNIANLGPIMTAAADRACERLASVTAQDGDRAADLFDEMVTATFEVISDVTFSGNDAFDRSEVHQAIDSYIAQTAKLSILDILGAPNWVPRPGRLVSGAALKTMKRMSDQAIDHRRNQENRQQLDLLDLMMAGTDPETKRQMSTPELRDNLLTFIVAGHETTALTLSWALYLCAFDADVQSKARIEARDILQGRAATAQDVANLPYIRAIIDETLRLYPPAAFLSRTAQKTDTLCGRDILVGDTVMIPVYALHRHHMLWDNPNAFRPDRFTDPKTIERFAYLPFGDGPRVCIGAGFAIQEAVIILATLLSRFEFDPVEGREPKPVMILTLRPEGGVWLKVRPVRD